ncbi:Rhodanese domain-containing protein [Mycena kentingensis (nom. inval.)]|nr:Rhodanese domain-containing protein [Mycena kentingensis (nom. inval.)]
MASADWHAAFPTPSSIPDAISATELAAILKDPKKDVLRDYIVVDVRRTDFEDVFIPGALNLPAHSFYPTLPTILKLLGSIPLVVFHCNSCKEGGRGWRVAAWYQDALKEAGIPETTSKGVILEGGIKGWKERFGEDAGLSRQL